MGTKVPAVARLESSGGKHRHSPTLETLRKYAHAVGCELVIQLVRSHTEFKKNASIKRRRKKGLLSRKKLYARDKILYCIKPSKIFTSQDRRSYPESNPLR